MSTRCFLPSFESTGFFSLGEEAKNRSTSHHNASCQVPSQLAFKFRRRSEKIDSQMGRLGGHLKLPIGRILAIFYLQVIPMLPASFEEVKNRFSRWPP